MLDEYLEELRLEFPRLRIVDKADDPLSRVIDGALRVLTLGGQSAYMTRYVTTLGRSIYLPLGWQERPEVERYLVMRHEAVHLRQFARMGRVGMALVYLLPVVPMGLAWGRARIEWEAYAETLRATAEAKGIEAAMDPTLHAHIVTQFTSAAYGWMWPFPRTVQSWIDEVIREMTTR